MSIGYFITPDWVKDLRYDYTFVIYLWLTDSPGVNNILWFLCKINFTINLTMSQSVGKKIKMSKKNEN
jgi:hypothetical protein